MPPEIERKINEHEHIPLIHEERFHDRFDNAAHGSHRYCYSTQTKHKISTGNKTTYYFSQDFLKRIIMIVAVTCLSSLLAFDLVRHVKNHKTEPHTLSKKEPQSTAHKVTEKDASHKNNRHYGLDLYVIGFAKCGTGTIRDLLRHSDGVTLLGRENNDLFNGKTDEEGLATLDSHFEDLLDHNATLLATHQRAIKNPKGITHIKSIRTLATHTSRNTRLILGIRHPVSFFQSYCNFRISAKVRHNDTLMTIDECYKRYFHVTRYDLYMKQLAKTDLSAEELMEMGQHFLELVPNKYKIFLYHLEQIVDNNKTRSEKLRSDFQHYAKLKNPITSWPINKVGHEKAAESIDICDPEFYEIRQELIEHGVRASDWILNKFLKSHDVVVGGQRDHFIKLLESWEKDICP